jgi:hypothetical protein
LPNLATAATDLAGTALAVACSDVASIAPMVIAPTNAPNNLKPYVRRTSPMLAHVIVTFATRWTRRTATRPSGVTPRRPVWAPLEVVIRW